MATYSEIKALLDEIARLNYEHRKTLERAYAAIVKTNAKLAAMPAEYSQAIADINQAVIDNPGNGEEVFLMAQAEKNQLVADFQALRTMANFAEAALDPIING